MEKLNVLGAINEDFQVKKREKLQLTMRWKKAFEAGVSWPFARPGLSVAGGVEWWFRG